MADIAPKRYSSRTNQEQDLVPRHEPVIYGKGNYTSALTAEQLDAYAKHGFLVIPHVFKQAEVDVYVAELAYLLEQPSIKQRKEAITEANSDTTRSLFAIHEFSTLFKGLIQDPRIADVARQILGSEVYIHQSRANLKPGFTGEAFYWHSDFETWYIEDGMSEMRALSCSVLLTDNDATNGPLMLVPGSHHYFVPCMGETPDEHYKDSLRNQQFGVPSQKHITKLADLGGVKAIEAPAGSVIFFDSNTLHGSSNNISPSPRSNLFVVYNSVENILGPPKHGLASRPTFLAYRGPVKPV